MKAPALERYRRKGGVWYHLIVFRADQVETGVEFFCLSVLIILLTIRDLLILCNSSCQWKPGWLTLWPRNTVGSPTEFREVSGIHRKKSDLRGFILTPSGFLAGWGSRIVTPRI